MGWTGSYQQVHHVGLVVPQRLHGVEDVHRPLVPEHLTDNADGAEGPAAASPVPVGRGGEAGGGPGSPSYRTAPTTCVHLLPKPSWLGLSTWAHPSTDANGAQGSPDWR